MLDIISTALSHGVHRWSGVKTHLSTSWLCLVWCDVQVCQHKEGILLLTQTHTHNLLTQPTSKWKLALICLFKGTEMVAFHFFAISSSWSCYTELQSLSNPKLNSCIAAFITESLCYIHTSTDFIVASLQPLYYKSSQEMFINEWCIPNKVSWS